MNRLVVIDDEAIIRQGLIGYIDWASIDCEVVADFENGQQALEFLKDESVDIVISDIKMPGADGIEVAKYIHDHYPLTRTILYTGYSDFAYAKSAIEYNVSDFIVKPSSMEHIIEIVKKNVEKIEELRKKNHQLVNLESQLHDIHQKQKLNVIKNVVVGIKMDQTSLEKTLKSYNIDVKSFCLLLYKVNRDKPMNDAQTIQFINLSLKELDQYTFILNDTTYGTLVALDKAHGDYYQQLLMDKCHEINNFVSNYIKGSIFIGISDVHPNLHDAPIAFMEAQRCLDNSFYENSPITRFSEYNGPKENPTFAERNLEKITQYLNKSDEHEATKTVVTMFTTMGINKEPVDYTKSMGIAVYTICMNCIHRHNLDSRDIFHPDNPYHTILKAASVDELIQVLSDMIHQILTYLSEGNNNYLIKKVNVYIEEHYYEPIKLADIANYVHINSSYLSRLYKDKTSQTITQTLRNIRIEKAKEMLLEGKSKTYEIAVLVGFEDPAYFSYVFKQATGYSPSQFKNNHL